jgi:hypothetical protein
LDDVLALYLDTNPIKNPQADLSFSAPFQLIFSDWPLLFPGLPSHSFLHTGSALFVLRLTILVLWILAFLICLYHHEQEQAL